MRISFGRTSSIALKVLLLQCNFLISLFIIIFVSLTKRIMIMAVHPLWSDEYWLPVMQLYMRKPVGVKPIYSRGMVELSLELHIPPQYLYEQMFRLRRLDTLRIKRLWDKYSGSPKRLAKDVAKMRQMRGFCSGGEFYNGVAVCETFEHDFRDIPGCDGLTPVMLIMILDLYFRLTPITMLEETPEIQELARFMKIKAARVVEVMDAFRVCDPYLVYSGDSDSVLLKPCRSVWQRFGNDTPEKLSAQAAQMREYFVI